MSKTSSKLTERQKSIVISLLGAYFSRNEVVAIFKEEYDIELSYQAVDWYWHNKQDEIKAKREKFDDENEPLPITKKKYRLSVRQKLVNDLIKHLWYEKPLMQRGMPVADDDGNAIVLKLFGNHDAINKILDSAQKELEPSKIALTDPSGEHEHSTTEETAAAVKRLLDGILDKLAAE